MYRFNRLDDILASAVHNCILRHEKEKLINGKAEISVKIAKVPAKERLPGSIPLEKKIEGEMAFRFKDLGSFNNLVDDNIGSFVADNTDITSIRFPSDANNPNIRNILNVGPYGNNGKLRFVFWSPGIRVLERREYLKQMDMPKEGPLVIHFGTDPSYPGGKENVRDEQVFKDSGYVSREQLVIVIDPVKKTISFKNIGRNPCYISTFAEQINHPKDQAMLSEGEIQQLGQAGGEEMLKAQVSSTSLFNIKEISFRDLIENYFKPVTDKMGDMGSWNAEQRGDFLKVFYRARDHVRQKEIANGMYEQIKKAIQKKYRVSAFNAFIQDKWEKSLDPNVVLIRGVVNDRFWDIRIGPRGEVAFEAQVFDMVQEMLDKDQAILADGAGINKEPRSTAEMLRLIQSLRQPGHEPKRDFSCTW